jgi:IS30 family transposase
MKRRARIYYTESQRALMWERWQKGESLQKIAQLFGRDHPSVQGILARTGGMRPAHRRRSRLALSLAEREEISRAVVAGQSIRSVAKVLGRAPSTVSREVKRNGGREGYRASQADQAAWDRAHRRKTCKLVANRALARAVAGRLQMQWTCSTSGQPASSISIMVESCAPRPTRPSAERCSSSSRTRGHIVVQAGCATR